MALVCDKLKFIYFLAPGTGSSALLQYLVDNFEIKKVPDSDKNIVLEDGETILKAKHSTFDELKKHNLLNEEQLNYLRITGTRNPYDYFYAEWYRSRTRFSKLLSDENSWIYQTPKGKQRIATIVNSMNLEFSEWLEQKLRDRYKKKKKLMLQPEYVNQADAYVRMENMNQDLHNILLKHCGIEQKVNVPKKNVTDRDRCYWQHYSAKARDMVQTVFKPYIKKFDYAF